MLDWGKAALSVAQNLPADIIDLMASLATVYGEDCYLGGGAVRDLIMGNPDLIKDWDFYFDFGRDDHTHMGVIRKFLPGLSSIAALGPEDRTYDTDIYTVLRGNILDRTYDFIFSGQKISDFDHAICQCSINCKTFELETTREFDFAVRHNIHKIFEKNLKTPYMTNKAIHDHTKRILKKYPWPVLVSYDE
jgi:tRNA nucleotidyltransferase/poly(A) polymerase